MRQNRTNHPTTKNLVTISTVTVVYANFGLASFNNIFWQTQNARYVCIESAVFGTLKAVVTAMLKLVQRGLLQSQGSTGPDRVREKI